MQKLHVLTRKEELDRDRLAGKVVVVLDVLFATSTIAAALHHGATEVIPLPDAGAARLEAQRHAAGRYLLAGEKALERIPGFAPYAPLALLREDLAGKTLIYATTNGTVALHRACTAAHVYAASLLNGSATAAQVLACHAHETVLLACAGSGGTLNLEDFYGAGFLVDRLTTGAVRRWELSDAALAVQRLYRHWRAEDCLLASRLGQKLASMGLADEVRFAARQDAYSIVSRLEGGRLRSDSACAP